MLLYATKSKQCFSVGYLAVVSIAWSPHLHLIACEVNSLPEGCLWFENLLMCKGFALLQKAPSSPNLQAYCQKRWQTYFRGHLQSLEEVYQCINARCMLCGVSDSYWFLTCGLLCTHLILTLDKCSVEATILCSWKNPNFGSSKPLLKCRIINSVSPTFSFL